jgi:Protein of unknown function (DUF5132)
MSLLEDVFKGGNLMTGVGVAIGVGVVAPLVVPVLRPLAKSVIKAGLLAYDQGRVALSELNEVAGDMVAEARSEIAHLGEGADETSGTEDTQDARGTGRQPPNRPPSSTALR